MKMMKKIATLILAVCLIVPCFSLLTYAADGKIMFSDPSAKVGETVEIKGVVEKSKGNFGKIEITMTYDTSMMKFTSGDGITESTAGTIKYSGDATRDVGTRKEFAIKFEALKAGTTTLKIQDATVKNVSGTVLNYTKGASTITIAQGEGTVAETPETSTEATVEVNGESYKFADSVPENEIPEGYEAATLDYDLVNYNVVYSAESGLYLAYLVNSASGGSLFMYVEENATFAPYEAVEITDEVTIALLSDVSEIILPKEYKKTEVVLNEHAFPAWQNADNKDFLVVYAVDNHGVKSLYQLDSEQGTYQRFIAPEVVAEEADTWLTKLSDVLENHLDYVILGTGLGFLIFILIIVILSVKLYNRNAELDEIYEEYGIDSEENETEDDVVLELDDEEDDDGEETVDKEMEFLVQEGMKEVFPEETNEEEISEEETIGKALDEVIENKEEDVKEESLAEALEQQKAAEEKTEIFDDDEVLLEDFSVDFIDLEDE